MDVSIPDHEMSVLDITKSLEKSQESEFFVEVQKFNFLKKLVIFYNRS